MTTSAPSRPCRCWLETWSQHDGHCCFAPDSPEDCHDTEGSVLEQIDQRPPVGNTNGLGGPMAERTYWLTKKGWRAALLAQHPSLGVPL